MIIKGSTHILNIKLTLIPVISITKNKSRGSKLHKSKKRLPYLLQMANTTPEEQLPSKIQVCNEIKHILKMLNEKNIKYSMPMKYKKFISKDNFCKFYTKKFVFPMFYFTPSFTHG